MAAGAVKSSATRSDDTSASTDASEQSISVPVAEVALTTSEPVSWEQQDAPIEFHAEPPVTDHVETDSIGRDIVQPVPTLEPGTNYLEGIPTEDGLVSAFVREADIDSSKLPSNELASTIVTEIEDDTMTVLEANTVLNPANVSNEVFSTGASSVSVSDDPKDDYESTSTVTPEVAEGVADLTDGNLATDESLLRTTDLAVEADDTLSVAASSVTDNAPDTTSTISELSSGLLGGLKDRAENLSGEIRDAANELGDNALKVTSDANESAGGLLGGLRDRMNDAASAAEKVVSSASETAAQLAGDTVEKANDTVSELGNTARSLASGVIADGDSATGADTNPADSVVGEASNDDEKDEKKPVFRYNPWM